MEGKRVRLEDIYMMTTIDIQKILEELEFSKKRKEQRKRE